jgi:CRP-like cAMP-binding protein
MAATPPPLSAFWTLLTDDERTALATEARMRLYPTGAALCHQGDAPTSVMLVRSGWTKIVAHSAAGQDTVLGVRGTGEIIGESGPLWGRPRSTSMYALEPVHALTIPGEHFIAFLDSHARASRVLAQTLVARLDDADRRMAARQAADGAQRLATLLVELADRYPDPASGDGAVTIGPPLSQQEMASWIGDSRETVARALHRWRTRGIVSTGRRQIQIADVRALRSIAATPD